MVLRIQYLKYRVSSGQLIPYFLQRPEDEELIARLITHLEAHEGRPRCEVDLETPLTWVPDVRIIKALIATALTRFYNFIPRQLEDLLTSEEIKALLKQGISNLEELRFWVWRRVEVLHGGFIAQKQRVKTISGMAAELNLKSEKIKELISAHRDEHMLLRRKNGSPSTSNLLGAYNFEVLETLLYNSESVIINLVGGSLGSAARKLLRLTKRFGVLIDLDQTQEGLRVSITGPRVFFGRASAFGWNIAQVLARLLEDAAQLKIQIIDMKIDVVLRDQHYAVHLTPETLPPLFPKGKDREVEAFLDSKLEKQFFWSWQNNKFRGWNIVREPDAILIDSKLIIPDFALIKDGKKVLVELIGYWREEYTQKKQIQLEGLKTLGLKNLILLVDRKHQHHFAKSAYPVIFYRSRGSRYEIPYGKILKVLPK